MHLGAGGVARGLNLMGHHHHTVRCGVWVSNARSQMAILTCHVLVLGIDCIRSRNALATVQWLGGGRLQAIRMKVTSGVAFCSSESVVNAVKNEDFVLDPMVQETSVTTSTASPVMTTASPVTTTTLMATTTTTTGVPTAADAIADQISAVEQSGTELVQASLSALFAGANGSSSGQNGSSGVLATIEVNASNSSGQLRMTLVDPSAVAENGTFEIEGAGGSGTVSIPGSVLQQIAANAGTGQVILTTSTVDTANTANASNLSDSGVLLDAGSDIVVLTFRDANGNPIEVGNLSEPIEFTLPVSDENVSLIEGAGQGEILTALSHVSKAKKPELKKVCWFWDKKKKAWSRVDLLTISSTAGAIRCKVYHLSSFVAGAPLPGPVSRQAYFP